MNGDHGGRTADTIEERLGRHYQAELRRAERDYSGIGSGAVAGGAGSNGRTWRRLVALPVGALVLVAVVVLVAPLVLPGSVAAPSLGPVPVLLPTGAPSAGAGVVVMGSDGLPDTIAGEHVYRLSAEGEWQKLDGSFLLGAFIGNAAIPCPAPIRTPVAGSAEDHLVPVCGLAALAPRAGDNTQVFFGLAPRSVSALVSWKGSDAIVIRAHTHDPEAAACAEAVRQSCDSALVVEAIVWGGPVGEGPSPWSEAMGPDGVPTAISGQRIYRAADAGTFPTSGTFLLGGRVTAPEFAPSCPKPIGATSAEMNLVPYCVWTAVDGIQVAPKGVDLTGFRNQLVVVRVHVNDAEAVRCPAAVRASCAAALVVDGIVWTGPPAASTPLASPSDRRLPPNIGSAGPAGPVLTPPAPPDVPSGPGEIGSLRVYRVGDAATFPSGSFLVYGYVVADVLSCPTIMPRPSAETDLISACGWFALSPVPLSVPNADPSLPRLAPRTLSPRVYGRGQQAIVLRVHSHDPEAEACEPATRSQCEAALVVEDVVWTPSTAAGPASS